MRSRVDRRHKSYTIQLQPFPANMMAPYPDVATAHNRDLALQKYMLLYSQHQTVHEHLDQLRPLVAMTSCNTAVTSPAHSPERSPLYPKSPANPISPTSSEHPAPTYPLASSRRAYRRSSMPDREAPPTYHRRGARLQTVVDEATLGEMAAEERKLFNVNECMKRTLTELLNCDDARNDHSFRMWVQCRLMETERELRTERRRRSSAGVDY